MAFEMRCIMVKARPENQMGHTAAQFQFVKGKPNANVDPISNTSVRNNPNAPIAKAPRPFNTKGRR